MMRQALAVAERARVLCPPNPAVGCCLVDAGGNLVGEGHTQVTGGPHAEVMALRAAAALGHEVRGATAYVTLEPCSHFGRTPPCADALVAAGVARVVVAVLDPNSQVAGRGVERLRAAGMAVDVGLLHDEARWLNIGFFSRMVRGRPWVRVKVAASLDGTTALYNGLSQWITGTAARTDGHAFRAQAGAIVTGIGTVLSDDPRLDVRLLATERQPLRVVVDSSLRIAATARILQPPGNARVYTASTDPTASAALIGAGCEVSVYADTHQQVDLNAMLRDLAQRGVNEVHVEAGHRLNGALLKAGLVDELLLYLAPKLLGPGRGMVDLGPLTSLAKAVQLRWLETLPIGDDLRLRAVVNGLDCF